VKPTLRARDGKTNLSEAVMLRLAPTPNREATIAFLVNKLKYSAEKAAQIVDSK
jgi:hypothetical protein